MNLETDRTAIVTYQRCPRERYWTREYNKTGLQPIKKSLPLVFGSAFHEAAQDFLGENGVDAAVARSLHFLDEQFSASAVDLDEPQTEYNVAEQKAIAEALVRGWDAVRREQFLETFEVLEVEQEGRATMNLHPPYLILLFRPDALVRERASGDLYIVSWKTSSTFGPWVTNDCQVDMQAMSEVWGVTQGLNCAESPDPMGIEGVLYLFAVKGQRRMDDYRGYKTQNTPLAYAWLKPGPVPDEDEWAWCYEWETEEFNTKTGKMVRTKLGKGWRKVPVWESYPGGVKQWVDDLVHQQIAPRHIQAFDQIFPEMLPVSRKASDVESWRRQSVANEQRVANKARQVEIARGMGDPEFFAEALDREFPQHTKSCYSFAAKCPVYDICWTEAVKQDPMASGLYQIRIPNHPTEKGDAE